MLFTTNWLSELFVDYKGAAIDPIQIDEVATDSRKQTEKALFVPIIGENFDGHDHIKEAFNNGAVAALWDKSKELPAFIPTDFPVFFVGDTVKALQQLAAAYRQKVNPVVIGITGSNGKTTTKDLVAAVVQASYKTHFTKGNLNNHIGVPLTVLSMPAETEALVVEMGMNHFGEIELLSNLAKPDIAIITNIGESHIEYLGSREGIAKAKLEIAKGLKEGGRLYIDGDESLLQHIHATNNVTTCGFNMNNDIAVKNTEMSDGHTNFQLADNTTYTIPLLGKHHALNATFAIAVAKQLNIPVEKIKKALTSIERTAMRFELQQGKKGAAIINDAYNASPTSMTAAINVVKQMHGFNQKVLVLGDMFELGKDAKHFHQTVGKVIEEPITAVFTYGEAAEAITNRVKSGHTRIDSRHFTTREELIAALEKYAAADTLILFKASRGMQFEWFVNKMINDA